jgi:D-3-phosphoglycerate dehydrogenase
MAVVVVSEWVDPAALEVLRAHHRVDFNPAGHRQGVWLKGALADAEGWIVRNQTQVDAETLALAPRLRVIGRLGVGLDNIDVAAVKTAGVALTWAPGSNAASVAEYVLGALVHLWRRFGGVTEHVRAGGWDRQGWMGHEMFGRTLGLIGLGDIGSRVARRARGFGFEVLAHDPRLHHASYAVQEIGVRLASFAEVLAEGDAVSLHLPLLPETRHLFGAANLARMRPGALLINTARGGLVDEHALAAALTSGHLGGAALDVREHEPPGADDPLRTAPNLLLTPHIAGVTVESNARTSRHISAEVLRALAGEPLLTPVA